MKRRFIPFYTLLTILVMMFTGCDTNQIDQTANTVVMPLVYAEDEMLYADVLAEYRTFVENFDQIKKDSMKSGAYSKE